MSAAGDAAATPARVLVTGASGFVGRAAVGALAARGFDVHATARRPPGDDAASWHAADLLDAEQRRALVRAVRPSHLLHLAWYAEPGAYWEARENAAWVSATIDLLDAFAAAGGRRAVLAGSCAEYDWTAPQPLREDAPRAPATYYGACKDATHRVCAGLAQRAGVRLAWGRLFFLHGPREDPRRLVASVAQALVAGQRAATSAGTQRRDLLHVDDAAAAFAALLDSDLTGAVNVASGDAVAVRDVVAQIGIASGRPELLEIGALPPRDGDPELIVADVARLRDELGFAPRHGLAAGIAATVAWWQAQPRTAVSDSDGP